MKTEIITIYNPDAKNLIFGQAHFIKTVEDIHEALVEIQQVPLITSVKLFDVQYE